MEALGDRHRPVMAVEPRVEPGHWPSMTVEEAAAAGAAAVEAVAGSS